MITRRRKSILIVTAAAGLFFCVIAVFAFELGLDNNQDWGRGRLAMLAFGLSLLGWAGGQPVWPAIQQSLDRPHRWLIRGRLWSMLSASLVRLKSFTQAPRLTPQLRPWPAISFGFSILVILFLYNWIFSAGRLNDWPAGSRYFHRLAEAFAAGQLHLLEEPGPELLATANPYFYLDRGEIPVLWDALFYDGKYYLYWGPVPGLIVAGLQPFSPERIRDSFLTAAFMTGYLAFAAALLQAMQRRFTWLPVHVRSRGLFAVGLCAPMVWLFTRPDVYEAAIAGGQFFLIGGLYFAFTALSGGPISAPRLSLAGLLWGLAANTRVNLALVITCCGLLVVHHLWSTGKRDFRPLRATLLFGLAFGLPLVVSAGGLMAYNQARFDSPFDFGYNYLITGPTIPEDPARKYSGDYILPNAFQYLLRPPRIQMEFPYIIVPWIKNDMWPNTIRLPPDYFYTEPVAGLLLTVPLVGISLAAVLRLGWLRLNGFPIPVRIPAGDQRLFAWLVWVLSGNILFSLPILLIFTQNTYRYLADLAPGAVLLSILALTSFQTGPPGFEKAFWNICWRVGVLLTCVFGVLIAVTGYENAFEMLNPGLFETLAAVFP